MYEINAGSEPHSNCDIHKQIPLGYCVLPAMNSEAWTRYYDEGYNAYYLYNEKTGESVWESDYYAEAAESSKAIERTPKEVELTEIGKNFQQETEHAESDAHDSLLRNVPTTFRSRDFPRDGPPQTSEQKSSYDLLCYSRFVFFNAILVEAPLAIIEGSLRIAMVSILLLVKLGYYAYLRQPGGSVPFIISYGREILLTSAAMLTLLMPGAILFVYRHYSYETEWELRPIPTVLGNVDARRFGTITFSSGSMAINSGASTSSISGASSVNNASARAPRTVSHSKPLPADTAVVTRRIGEHNQDTWRGTLKWVPREIYNDICRFISGDNSIQSLNIAL